ncbi:uncharacterized protein LOC119080774 [Bradysia coprophila]|uniref:uncharacterized protein LOC119080774 n=1 Tax=Bradysia coprophila TaxID=38358 RepID=UPI00187DC51A|nr:uncharacterized protein LOC119080774 [Bradysia coprophila]
MTDPAEESGAQLLARLASVLRPQLNDLDPFIFPNHGLFPNEIAEIAGDSGLGKTALLMHIMAKVVLPVEYGGRNGRVYLLLTEHNFDVEKFMWVLNKYLDERTVSTEPIESDVLHTSLQNLTIQRCFDETQFELAIYNLHRVLQESSRYCLLAVDNIGAFYHTPKNQEKGQPLYLKEVLTKLRLVVNQHHVSLVYTKPAYFTLKSVWNIMEMVNYFLKLSEMEDSSMVYEVGYKGQDTIRKCLRKYEFDMNGCIEWK